MPLVKHFLLRGHVFLSLQLHVLLVGGAGVDVGFNGGVGVNVGDQRKCSPSPTLTPTPPLKPTSTPAPPINKTCNCRDKNTCPLNKKCLTKGIVYHAKITAEDNEETRHYIGITATTFKERFRNHQKSFNIATYANDTELSKYIWSLKKSNRPYKIKWTILKHSSAYRSGRNQCNLCSDEKLFIMKFKKNSLLNKRSEIFSNCVHKKQFLAGKYICVQSNNVRHHT